MERIRKVYWEFFAFKFLIAGILAFGLWHLTDPFLTCWLGDEFLLSRLFLLLIIINEFILQIRYTTDAYIMGYGLFQDIWAPVTEAILSVVVAVLGGYFWGLEGVMLGTIVSMIIIICIWKPYFLFREGIKQSVWVYWLNFSKYSFSLLLSFIVANKIIEYVNINPSDSFAMWGLYAVIIISIFSLILFAFLYMLNEGMRDFSNRIFSMVKSKFGSR